MSAARWVITDAMSYLRQADDLVLLEGPELVSKSASELRNQLAIEFAAVRKLIPNYREGKSLWKTDEDAYNELRKKVLS